MSLESSPAKKPRPPAARPPLAPALLDLVLIAAFLALTFLLGAFPLKDTDFWWHLRTGDLIRQTGQVPHTDLYTFTVPDHPWIDDVLRAGKEFPPELADRFAESAFTRSMTNSRST